MNSLRVRLIIAASLVLAVFVLIAGFALDRAFYESAERSLRENLDTQVTLLLASTEVIDRNDVDMPTRLLETRFSLPSSGLYAIIVNDQSRILWKSLSTVSVNLPPPRYLPAGEQHIQRVELGGEEFFIKSLGIAWYTEQEAVPLTFNVITDLHDFNAQILAYRQTLWGWLVGLALILLLAQLLILVWGLKPVVQVIRELNAIESGTQARISGSYPRELMRLTDNINGLLEHEHTRQTRYRNALADLAHSLKTPLAVLIGNTSEIQDAPLRQAIAEQVQRMDHIVAHQLQRAATAGSLLTREQLPARPVADKLLRTLDKVYQAKHIRLKNELHEDLTVRVDEGDLLEVMGNILDNACKWCTQQVRIGARVENRRVHFTIEDDGPGIDQQQIEIILRRGGRIDESKPGQGIGLSVAVDIVSAYDGRLTIAQSRLGGAAFSFDLPAA